MLEQVGEADTERGGEFAVEDEGQGVGRRLHGVGLFGRSEWGLVGPPGIAAPPSDVDYCMSGSRNANTSGSQDPTPR
jgi:hypothetical protein